MEFQLNNLMPHISAWFTDVKLGSDQLLSEEQILIGNYAANRASDFATGRYCAHRAMLHLGLPQIPVLIGENNQPCWPAGYTGSISHTDGLTGAIIASKTHYRSLGIDLEVIGRVRPDLWHVLFTEEELNWLEGLSATEATLESTILFSLKEAFYKMQYPLTGTFLDFPEVSICKHADRYELSGTTNHQQELEKLKPFYAIVHTLHQHVACIFYSPVVDFSNK